MITLKKRRYERIVSYLISGGDIRAIADQFTMDRVFYFHVLRDIASGDRSPNYRILKRIAAKRKVSEDFIVEQARSVINYTIPNYQAESPDYYKTLEVSREASDEEIRRKWIELMRSHHPDMAGANGLDTAMRINEAYEVLGNAERREAYDRRFLPSVPVIVPYSEIPRGFYMSAPIALVILIALVYASGSGLIFKSQEEKEQLAKVIEKPALPNPVYRGDAVESRTQMLEESVSLNREEDYSMSAAQRKLTDEAPVAAAREKAADEPGIKISETEEYKTLAGETVPPKPDVQKEPAAEEKKPEEAKVVAENAAPIEQTTPQAVNETPEKIAAKAEPVKEENNDEIVAEKEEAPSAAVAVEDKKPDNQIRAEAPVVALKEEAPAPAEAKKEPAPEKPEVAKAAPEKTPAPEKSMKENSEPVPAGTYYTVRNGDSLWTIARKFDTTTAELSRLNGINGNNLGVGKKLLVSGDPVLTAEAEKPEPKTEIRTVAEARKAVLPAPEPVVKVVPISAPAPARRSFDTGLATTAVAREAEIARPVPIPVSGPDKNTLYNFVSEYKTAYMGRDLSRLKTLFSPDAVENGVSMANVMNKYDSNFSALDIIDYDIKVHRALIQNSYGFVRGDFFITYKDTRTGTLKNSRGNINWKLAWQQDEWKIIELNYKIESTGGVDG